MKKMFKKSLFEQFRKALLIPLLGFPLLFMAFKFKTKEPTLTLQIDNVKENGTFYISVCTKAADWSGHGQYTFTLAAEKQKQNVLDISTLPNGVYAIAIYQDLNGNGKLDTNFFGIPKEPFGFSNNKVPIFSEPSFEQCRFQFNQEKQKISIKLLN